jgi:exonuclease SbcD
MRLLHTSDWHLGHTLREHSREAEHREFLRWLLDTLESEAIEVLLISGDIFDSSIPAAAAEAMWFGFLADLRRRFAHLPVVAICGNHDSPSRLAATSRLCKAVGVHVVAALPRNREGQVAPEEILVDLGAVLVAPIPFLRPHDLAPDLEPQDAAQQRIAAILAAARRARRPDQALVVMAHLYLTGAHCDWLSERRTVIGGQEAAPLHWFADDLAYVALGHLHKAQRVGSDHVRYAGSPIPLAVSEAHYPHQVVVVDVGGGAPARIRSLRVPRTVEILRIPVRGAMPLDEVIAAVERLPLRLPDSDPERLMLLELAVALPAPLPMLRQIVEAALDGRAARLVRLVVEYRGDGVILADRAGEQSLAEIEPREVLVRRWAQLHQGAPPDEVVAAFERLVDEARLQGAR